jgi:predicted RNA-binding Zn-ribbon protein involved in translation (DUF1610 family)
MRKYECLLCGEQWSEKESHEWYVCPMCGEEEVIDVGDEVYVGYEEYEEYEE